MAASGRLRTDRRGAPSAWARMGALLVDYAARTGAARNQLLAHAGLSEAALLDPDARIPLLALYDLLEGAVGATRDACFGLHFATSLEMEDLDALGFLMLTSSTFGSAMERMFMYQRVWAEGEHFEMKVEGERVRVTFQQYGPARPAHFQMAQVALSDFTINGSRFVPGLKFEGVSFRHERPENALEFERLFPTEVTFGARVDEVRFPAEVLELPMPDANAKLCEFFDRYTRNKLEHLPAESSILGKVRDRLRRQLPDGGIKLDQVAAGLRMSARTLQRRLSAEGTSLHAELDEVRRQQALYFLETGVAIAELSWLLGYSEPSAFHRAFKRWTDTSPEAWRSANRGA